MEITRLKQAIKIKTMLKSLSWARGLTAMTPPSHTLGKGGDFGFKSRRVHILEKVRPSNK